LEDLLPIESDIEVRRTACPADLVRFCREGIAQTVSPVGFGSVNQFTGGSSVIVVT
jgi:hypothetical protein